MCVAQPEFDLLVRAKPPSGVLWSPDLTQEHKTPDADGRLLVYGCWEDETINEHVAHLMAHGWSDFVVNVVPRHGRGRCMRTKVDLTTSGWQKFVLIEDVETVKAKMQTGVGAELIREFCDSLIAQLAGDDEATAS